ncbi:uncharacterized protein [Miscanthus floridulus]|uniref:uncharacterized protein isoform X2 n=1 Tax=Miscanthus floridulus TaxID=154761 RepID=UPI00345A6D2A
MPYLSEELLHGLLQTLPFSSSLYLGRYTVSFMHLLRHLFWFRIPAVGPSPANPSPSGGNLPIPKILPLAKWVFSAAIFAVPMYRRFRTLEAKIEKTAEVAIEVIDKVAEATEKVADEVAEEFPGNESIKKAASKIKKVMDVIEEDADKAEALIEKVDEIKKEVDSTVDPIINKFVKDKS